MAEGEQFFPAAPFAGPGARVLVTPFQFTTETGDRLRVVSANSLTGVRLAIHGRRFDETGRIVPFRFTHTPNTDRSVATEDVELGAGALINLAVFAEAGQPLSGQTYVIMQLLRGAGDAAIVLGVLLAGYVTSTQAIAWPGSPIVSSTAGEPIVRTIVGTNPAAGANISETCPTGARWELLSVLFELATDANVANRRVILRGTTPSGQVWRTLAANTQPASQTFRYSYAAGLEFTSDTGFSEVQQPLPIRALLAAGDSFVASWFQAQAGDNLNAPNYLVREWLEVP